MLSDACGACDGTALVLPEDLEEGPITTKSSSISNASGGCASRGSGTELIDSMLFFVITLGSTYGAEAIRCSVPGLKLKIKYQISNQIKP